MFRQFYEELLDSRPGDEAEVVGRWRTRDELDTLAPLRHRDPSRMDRTSDGQRASSHIMYALSRVSDFLIEKGCPPGDVTADRTGVRKVDQAVLAVHERFFDVVGLRRYEHAERFSPFHHEIVAVTTDDTLDAVSVDSVLWPGFFFGDLLFCRAGVHVRAPSALIDAATATTSTLYFTFRREPRRTNDLSHGPSGSGTCFPSRTGSACAPARGRCHPTRSCPITPVSWRSRG